MAGMWTGYWTRIILLAGSFSVLYGKTLVGLAGDWLVDDNFSHGFFIPMIAVYMISRDWNETARLPAEPCGKGMAVILAGMMMHLLGNLGAELFTGRVSIIVTLLGTSLFFLGKRWTRRVLVPVLYLLFMIPVPSIIWYKLAFPLQTAAAALTAHVVAAVSVPVFREGNILHLTTTSLEVVEACSGLRSLTSLLALSCAFAYLSPLSRFSKWVVFVSAIPIAIIVNVVRLTITAMTAYFIGPESAQGGSHEISGILVFMLAFLLVYAIAWALGKAEIRVRGGWGRKPFP